MIEKHIEMNKIVADEFVTMVHEYDLPVDVHVGLSYMNSNGDYIVIVRMEYALQNGELIDRYLSQALNQAIKRLALA